MEDWEAARERSRARREAARRRQAERRRRGALVGAGGAAGLLLLAVLLASGGGGSGGGGSGAGAQRAEAEEKRKATLPGGGRRIFPGRRVVAFYGTADTPVLGTLGEGPAPQVARRLQGVARRYRTPGGPKVLPAFELIATVASASPGEGSLYRGRKSLEAVRRYHRAIRRAGGILIIDVQPGRARFIDEVRRFEPLLREPDVSLALDPEWKMQPGEVPGQTIGHTDAAEVNEVTDWLAALVKRENLPQKLLVIHQFTPDMVQDRARLATPPGVAVTIHVDGFGGREVKRAKYRELRPRARLWTGFKLFYDEDVNIFAPRDVLGFRPAPLLITYQ